jgi:hypothetical protein
VSRFKKMTDEDFNRILADKIDEESGGSLLLIPGVYEVLSEHFNNEVLETWEEEQE